MNSVNEVEMTVGSRVWPIACRVNNGSQYRCKDWPGMLIATALFAARMSSKVRIYLIGVELIGVLERSPLDLRPYWYISR